MNKNETLGRRKEPRFKTEQEQALQCDCFHEDDDPKPGSVIDLSTHGLRFLCEGNFRTGQVVLVELKTERSYGAFGGIIRRADPWVGGQIVYGCELVEPLTGEVLEALAQEGIVNRRREDRVQWTQPAKMSWELQSGEIDIEIHDCSIGGLKISCADEIPDDARLRIRVESVANEEAIIDAKAVWKDEFEGRSVAGLAFSNRRIPEAVSQVIKSATESVDSELPKQAKSIRPSILVAATIVLLVVTLARSGMLP